jgi:hypothetical protein
MDDDALAVHVRFQPSYPVITVAGGVDIATAPRLHEPLAALARCGRPVIADLDQVAFHRRRRAACAGRRAIPKHSAFPRDTGAAQPAVFITSVCRPQPRRERRNALWTERSTVSGERPRIPAAMRGNLLAQTAGSRRAELDVLRPVTPAAQRPANALDLPMSAHARRDGPGCRSTGRSVVTAIR